MPQINNLEALLFIREKLNAKLLDLLDAATAITISSGSATITQPVHTITAETPSADNLDTLTKTGLAAEQLIYIRATAGNTITIRSGEGNIITTTGKDYIIPTNAMVALLYDGANWRIVASTVFPIANESYITWSVAGGTLANVLRLNSSDDIELGSATTGDVKLIAGDQELLRLINDTANSLLIPENNIWLSQYNAALDTAINIIKVNASDEIEVGSSSANILKLVAGDQELLRMINSTSNSVLIVENDIWLTQTDNGGTGTVSIVKVNTSDEIDLGAVLNVGPIELAEDSGAVTLVNLPVTSTPADGDEESYTFAIGSNPILKVKASADHAGGVDGLQLLSYGGRIENVTTVNAATYTILEDDYDLSVTYTATGACAITIPAAQDVSGRTLYIADDGGLAGTNNITVYDDVGPNLLFTINTNNNVFQIRYNGTAWRVR